jgi:CBS-domain-containing membrane protein
MIGRGRAAGLRVGDVMDAEPKTTPADTTVGQLREQFHGDAHVRTALVTDGAMFLGAVALSDLPPDADADELVSEYARRPATVTRPDRPVADALAWLDAADECRVVVLGEDDRTLLGLVCMNPARTHFCVPKHRPAPATTIR